MICDHCSCTKYHGTLNTLGDDTGECLCGHLEECHAEVDN